MGLVASIAFGGCHFSVRFVALGALRDLAVDSVTGGTDKCGMLALVFLQLSILPCVAGHTGVCA